MTEIPEHLRKSAEAARKRAAGNDPLYPRLDGGPGVDALIATVTAQKDAEIAALNQRVRELEAKVNGLEEPEERGFIIAAKFAPEQLDVQTDWFTEIETIVRQYATITHSDMTAPTMCVAPERPGEYSISFYPL